MPQYAHLTARAPRRGRGAARVRAGRGSGAAMPASAFRPHPVADPVKLRVSAH
ncbi:uncharacterized protein BCN122_I2596 [Burkholderia cenocepacia]|nr:uncharacterized protein BCN122_I2596 [Burkholderia cenocepacia]